MQATDGNQTQQSVSYWRMRQPEADTRDTINADVKTRTTRRELLFRTSIYSSDSDPEEYEVLNPSVSGTHKILEDSTFYRKYMPSMDVMSQSLLRFSDSFPIRMGPVILASLVRRFTDARFNWENKTLQSFLEVACWASVTFAAYSLYHDWFVALQIGTFAGALMSICDEVMLQFVRGLARAIRNQHGGGELLQQLGFDIPTNGKAPTSGQEVELIKNLAFGSLGVVAIRSLWENLHDIQYFALLTAAASATFIVTAEFFCLWLPTRRVGLTLQNRFTRIRQNWADQPVRSLVELLAWTLTTMYFYVTTSNFFFSLQTGTLVAVVVCLLSGLEDLPDVVSPDDEIEGMSECSYWNEQLSGDALVWLAKSLVKLEDVAHGIGMAVQAEAMEMYENWSM